MAITTTTHLNFRGQAREALEHYRSVVGGELVAVTFADARAVTDPAEADQVLWGQVAAPSGFRVMAFDVPAARPFDRGRDAVFVAVSSDDAGEVTACFEGLARGGVVRTALGPSAFSPLYGMVDDRFGITWVISLATPPSS